MKTLTVAVCKVNLISVFHEQISLSVDSQQAVHMFSSRGDVVVVFTGQAQFSAVTLVNDVPKLLGRQSLWKSNNLCTLEALATLNKL